MSTIKGIFVPFSRYVQDQLSVRQSIIASAQTVSFLQEGSKANIDIHPARSYS